MDVKDLRIGNWILDCEVDVDSSNYWEVEEIQKLSNSKALNQTIGITYRNGSCWSCDIEPIPLTEEWLVKLGFEKPLNGSWCTLGDIELDLTKGIRYFIFGNIKEINIKYVHQLQNLYHALTGKELKEK